MEIRWRDMPQLRHYTGVNIDGVTADRIPQTLLRQNQLLLERSAQTGALWEVQPRGVQEKQRKAERRCQILQDMLAADSCCPHQRLDCVQDMMMVWDWESICLHDIDKKLMPPPAVTPKGIQGN